MEQKITLKDYQRLQEFSTSVIELNGTLAVLNHHIEVLKRSCDVVAIDALQCRLFGFVNDVIKAYTVTLKGADDEN